MCNTMYNTHINGMAKHVVTFDDKDVAVKTFKNLLHLCKTNFKTWDNAEREANSLLVSPASFLL